jgi:endonuclease YncB( thermonuclease family)
MQKKLLFISLLILSHLQTVSAQEAEKSPVVRDVTPPGVVRIYRSTELNAASDSKLSKFSDIQVLPNGTLRSSAKTIQLQGITLPKRQRICVSSSGQRWACGVAAYVALRNLVQSRSIACNLLIEGEKNSLGQCKIEQTDIATWLLQEGWAELAVGATEKVYVDAATSAKTRAVGLWSDGSASFEKSKKPR